MTLYRMTGFVLIIVPITFNIVFFALGRAFEYPDILRKPTDVIFTRFAQGGKRLIVLWYAFAITALSAIPMALLFQGVFFEQHPILSPASAIMGVLSGLVQGIGLLRWPLLVPMLTAQYHAEKATSEQRNTVIAIFNAFHQFVGVVIGEHLGYIFTGSWTIIICLMMISSTIFSSLLGILGIISALGIMVGLLEPTGWKPAGAINAMSYILWSLWLIVSGITLLLA